MLLDAIERNLHKNEKKEESNEVVRPGENKKGDRVQPIHFGCHFITLSLISLKSAIHAQ